MHFSPLNSLQAHLLTLGLILVVSSVGASQHFVASLVVSASESSMMMGWILLADAWLPSSSDSDICIGSSINSIILALIMVGCGRMWWSSRLPSLDEVASNPASTSDSSSLELLSTMRIHKKEIKTKFNLQSSYQ